MKKEIEAFLKKKRIFTTKEAEENGFSRNMLSYYKKKGIIRSYMRGVYLSKSSESPPIDPLIEELIIILHKISDGIVCLITALYFYELTEEIPSQYWIAIPHKKWAPKIKNTKIIRKRNFNEGRTNIKISGINIPIYDRERTVIDCFKYLDNETAVKALKMYLNMKGKYRPDLNKLRYYSENLQKDVSDYIVGIIT